jgi:hypothetical protein
MLGIQHHLKLLVGSSVFVLAYFRYELGKTQIYMIKKSIVLFEIFSKLLDDCKIVSNLLCFYFIKSKARQHVTNIIPK